MVRASAQPWPVDDKLCPDAMQLLRVEDFLHRHHLYDQFLAEDAQGKGPR